MSRKIPKTQILHFLNVSRRSVRSVPCYPLQAERIRRWLGWDKGRNAALLHYASHQSLAFFAHKYLISSCHHKLSLNPLLFGSIGVFRTSGTEHTKESIFNLLTGFGESAVFVPLHKEGDRISISKHCVFNEICPADPPTMARLIRSR